MKRDCTILSNRTAGLMVIYYHQIERFALPDTYFFFMASCIVDTFKNYMNIHFNKSLPKLILALAFIYIAFRRYSTED